MTRIYSSGERQSFEPPNCPKCGQQATVRDWNSSGTFTHNEGWVPTMQCTNPACSSVGRRPFLFSEDQVVT